MAEGVERDRRRIRLTFSVPASIRPSGGPILMYSLADAMARRGHESHVVHHTLFRGQTSPFLAESYPRSTDDIGFHRFDPLVTHHFVEDPLSTPECVPTADVVIKGEEKYPDRCGRPVILLQGAQVFEPRVEEALFASEGSKVCVSEWLCEHAIGHHGVDPRLVHRFTPGLSVDTFAPYATVTDRPIDVCMAYNEWPTKGAEAGIRALSLVRERHPQLSAVLFGTADMRHLVPDWLPYIQGRPPPALAAEVFGRSKVLLNPSRKEGFGLTSVEAMAAGCALVTAANGGSREFARDGDTALVVEDGSAEGMATAVKRLVDESDERRRIARRGAALTHELSWDRSASSLESVLARILAT